MRVSILGGGGFLGRKLAQRLAKEGSLGGKPVTTLTLFDLAPPPAPEGAGFPVLPVGGDLAELPDAAIPPGTDIVFHLAAVVSAQAEEDYDLGRRVNLRGTEAVIDACRRLPSPPRVVFASSVASFSGGQREVLSDDARQVPANSYGAQKAIGELLLADYSRRGFFDGIGIRLPTICIRPGAPNKAASGFFSNILREPLAGKEAVLPVSEDVRHWHATPRSAVGFLLHAGTMDLATVGPRRNLTMPGLSATVGEQIAALKRVAGEMVAARIKRVPDPFIIGIVDGWPRNFAAKRARDIGFTTEEHSFDDIIRIHIEYELGGQFVA
jgi:nucleoside-diphosphate-sugar epimerase